MTANKVLVVDDQASVCFVLQDLLERKGYRVTTAGSFDEALPVVEGDDLGAVITDLKMPGKSGMDLLTFIRRKRPEVPVIMITGHGNINDAVNAMKKGASDFITKPIDETELMASIEKAMAEAMHNRDIPSDYFEPEESFDTGFVGDSEPVKEIFRIVDKIGPTDSTVLITGETGVGKELIARSLHLASSRKKGPFVKVHCAAIPESLVESELFGYEKGAFTGAVSDKPGRFELAGGGTLFLDEVGEIPLLTQVKLLAALQDRTFERVGGVRTVRTDIRIVAATNKDLEQAVREGAFRADLYFRLAVVPILIPPLRERRGDIGLQARYFLNKFRQRHSLQVDDFPNRIMSSLYSYNWPGNTRELENVVERLVLMAENGSMSLSDLPMGIGGREEPDSGDSLKERSMDASRAAEKNMIAEALKSCSGNRTRAAEALGISRRTLYKKIKEYGL
ncbi:MAG: sigma-54 dependent transcriptional regulator [Pseudomonadota bacterium]|jgi:DNA-binding NtrC family response regulator